jgi:DNA-binding NtrC family response regulator
VEKWSRFGTEVGRRCQTGVIPARTGAQALTIIREKTPVAILADEQLGDMSGVHLVPKVLQINAMIHVALVSGLSQERFHEETEGLGILMKLPPMPDRLAAVLFAERLLEAV